MDINLIQNIVYGVLFSYAIISIVKGLVEILFRFTTKLILRFRLKKLKENVDAEYIDFLKGETNVK